MPFNYTPVNTFHATIPVPVDTDPPNASSVSTPLEYLADLIAYTQGNWLPISGGTMQGTIVLAASMGDPSQVDDENTNQIPGWVSSVQAATGHKKLLAQWAVGPSLAGHVVYGRLFSSGTQIEETVNAGWNDGTGKWTYDVVGQSASRRRLNLGANILESYSGANTWADGAWATLFATGTNSSNTTGFQSFGFGGGAGAIVFGGATGFGAAFNGGATSGSGAIAQSNGGNSYGLEAYGFGSQYGAIIEGGATGGGALINAGDGFGAMINGAGGGFGVVANGGATGSGILGSSGGGNGNGGIFQGTGSGAGAVGTAEASTSSAGLIGNGGNVGGAGVVGNGGSANGPGVVGNATGNATGVSGSSAAGLGMKATGNAQRAAMNFYPQTQPATAQEGDLYWDSVQHNITGFDGTNWDGTENEHSIALASTAGGAALAGTLYFWKDICGTVHLDGNIGAGGTAVPGSDTIGTIPVGWRPRRQQTFMVQQTYVAVYGGGAYVSAIQINTDGTVVYFWAAGAPGAQSGHTFSGESYYT